MKLNVLEPRPGQKQLLIFFPVVVLIIIRYIASISIHLYDDAFITFRYAENLSSGMGFVYNKGEMVMGLTGPFYGLILSFFHKIGFNLQPFVVFLNISVDVVILYFTLSYFSKQGLFFAGAIFAILFSMSPLMNRITVGGMEMNIFLLCSLISILLYSQNRKYLSTLIATSAYFLRPEGALLVIILIIYEFFTGKKHTSLKMILLSFAVLIVPLSLLYINYGSIFSQSVLSKNGYHDNLWYIIKGWLFCDFVMITAFPFAVWGAIRLFNMNKALKIMILWGSAYALANFVMRQKIFTWYPYPVHYVQLFLAGYGLYDILSRLKFMKKSAITVPLIVILNLSALALWIFVLVYKGSNPVQNNLYNPLQKWSDENDMKNKTFLASDIGIIGYVSKSYIYDSEDLVTKNTIIYRKPDGKINREMIKQLKPDYIFLNLRSPYITLIQEFQNVYRPIIRFSEEGQTNLYPKASEFGDYWHPDYIIYKKVE